MKDNRKISQSKLKEMKLGRVSKKIYEYLYELKIATDYKADCKYQQGSTGNTC